MAYQGKENRTTAWHMSKEVTVSTLLAILLAYTTGLGGYFSLKADVEQTKQQVTESTEDRIRKATVVQMFANKDIQILAVKADVEKLQKQSEKIEGKIDKLNDLMLEIGRNMPRRGQ